MVKVVKEYQADVIKTTLTFDNTEFTGSYNTTGVSNKPENMFDFEFKKKYNLDEDDKYNNDEYFLDSCYSKEEVLTMLENIEYGDSEEIQEAISDLTDIEGELR